MALRSRSSCSVAAAFSSSCAEICEEMKTICPSDGIATTPPLVAHDPPAPPARPGRVAALDGGDGKPAQVQSPDEPDNGQEEAQGCRGGRRRGREDQHLQRVVIGPL